MSDEPSPGSTNYRGVAALVAAVLFAAAVGVAYLVASGGSGDAGDGDSGTGADSGVDLPFGGTPVQDLPGMPTRVPNTGPLEPNRPEIGARAPDFALVDVRDQSVIRKLSDFNGKPVVLNWYASWCDPCRNEMPSFQRAQDTLGDRVVFLGINYIEIPANARSILDETGAKFPAVLDSTGAVSDHYRIGRGLPVTMFLDRDHIVRAIHRGEVQPEELTEALAAIGLTYDATAKP